MTSSPAPGRARRPATSVTVLSGGVGGARFLQGLLRLRRAHRARDTEVTVVANTADDIWLHGLKVCPDLDTVMYTLGGGIDAERGWGRTDETWHAKEELAAYGVEPTWFGLGDRDLATHLVRTQMLEAGYPLSRGDRRRCAARWQPGRAAAADDRRPGRDARRRSTTPTSRPGSGRCTSRSTGSACTPRSRPAPWSRSALDAVDARPRRARGDHRRRRGARAAVQPGRLGRHDPRRARGPRRAPRDRRARSSASPPIVAGDHVRGMAAPAAHRDRRRGQRRRRWPSTTAPAARGGVLDGWLVDTADAARVERVAAAGIACRAVPLMMTDHDATAEMAAAALDLAAEVRA